MIIGNPAKIRVSVIPLGIPGIRVVKPEEPKIGKETGDTIEKAIMASIPFRRPASHRDREKRVGSPPAMDFTFEALS